MIPNRKALVSIGLLVIAGTIQAATVITTCPFVITSPGDYVLRADLICGGGDGITIKTSGVSLRLEGHKTTAGERANRAIAVNPQTIGSPPTIQNVHILGPGLITNGGGNTFSAGVFLLFAVNSEVSGITVLGSGSGIVADECSFVTITANTLGRNTVGLDLGTVNLSTISENDVSGNGTGISLDAEDGAAAGTLSHNVINGNTGVGPVD
jgi:Periplasmic copper-binding protein (NosD)